MNISTRRRNCIITKRAIGTPAKQMIGSTIHDCSRSMIKRAAEKAIIMVAIEKKRVERPIIIFVGKDLRKSSSAYRDEKRDKASEIIKIMNKSSRKNSGKPVSCLLPPGIVKVVANIMVIMRALTTVQDVAVSFIHCSPAFNIASCCFVNNSWGVKPSLFF
ncbi:hypothetical protein I3760_13G113400 [Carya illinoinensis]|nr:hypothetical protein I3760_13G113400 [Carya illinoinensis]